MLKKGIHIIQKKGLYYIVQNNGKPLRFKPWLGDAFSFLYDPIMERFIFPKKFGGDMRMHHDILSRALQDVHGKRVLELAAGSGSAVNFLKNDNKYTGADISPGLLIKATNKFQNAGFQDPQFYVARAEDIPFADNVFDVCLCILSLNFFEDIDGVLREIRRLSTAAAVFVCAVPVPERNILQSRIRGALYSQSELEARCRSHGFEFESLPESNGALLYFRAFAQ